MAAQEIESACSRLYRWLVRLSKSAKANDNQRTKITTVALLTDTNVRVSNRTMQMIVVVFAKDQKVGSSSFQKTIATGNAALSKNGHASRCASEVKTIDWLSGFGSVSAATKVPQFGCHFLHAGNRLHLQLLVSLLSLNSLRVYCTAKQLPRYCWPEPLSQPD